MRDVSKFAGVSATTVSRVLNNSTVPSPETRQRVLEAVDKLGYRVDALFGNAAKRDRPGARGGTAASGTIGYLANLRYFTGATRADGYYSEVAGGIESVLRPNGQHLMLESLEWGQRDLPSCVSARKVDGILVEGTIDPSLRAMLVGRLPVVFVDRAYPELPASCVFPDYAQSVREQLRYLWELGHRNVAILWHDDVDYQQVVSLAAFEAFFREAGVPVRHPELCVPRRITPETESTVFGQYAADLLATADRPTALIGPNAYVLPVCRHLQAMGCAIPRDISVIGTNDQFSGQMMSPALTSWQMSMGEVGRTAAEVLLQKLADPARRHRRIAIDGTRVERGSCAAPAA
jgi:LacI family fructose operon transcriptional repressor